MEMKSLHTHTHARTHARVRARMYFKTSKQSFFIQKNQKNLGDPMKYHPQECLNLKGV